MKQYEINKDAKLILWPAEGVADSATFELQDCYGNSIVAETNATLGSAYATGSATQYDESFTISDITHFSASKPYWISTSAYGRGYEERCLDVAANGSEDNGLFTLFAPCRFSFTNGLIRDHSLCYTYEAASNTAIQRGCVAIWRYQIQDDTYTYTQTIDFVKKPFKLNITEQDIEKVSRLFGIQNDNASAYLGYIQQAENDIYIALRGEQLYPDQIVEKELLKGAAIYRVLQFRHLSNLEKSEKFESLYESALSKFLTSRSWIVDEVSDGAVETNINNIGPKYMLIG
jgi:hypothetical protein